jgi:hypothetical protein
MVYYDATAGDITAASFDPSIFIASDKSLRIQGFIFDEIDEYTETMSCDGSPSSFVELNFVNRQPIQTAKRFKTQAAHSTRDTLCDIGITITAGLSYSKLMGTKHFSRHEADFAAFRLHLIKNFSQESDVETSDLAPEWIPALQDVAKDGDLGAFFHGLLCVPE